MKPIKYSFLDLFLLVVALALLLPFLCEFVGALNRALEVLRQCQP
jgi:hypothetical protein